MKFIRCQQHPSAQARQPAFSPNGGLYIGPGPFDPIQLKVKYSQANGHSQAGSCSITPQALSKVHYLWSLLILRS